MHDVKFGVLFPWPFRLVALCTIILALGIIQNYLWISVILLVICFLILVSYEGTEINPTNKTYREYTSFLVFKTGKFKPYSDVERIFINRSKESQQMYTARTSHSSTFEHTVYNAYLKFSNGEKIHLQKTKSKDQLMRLLKPLGEAVQVEITDNT